MGEVGLRVLLKTFLVVCGVKTVLIVQGLMVALVAWLGWVCLIHSRLTRVADL